MEEPLERAGPTGATGLAAGLAGGFGAAGGGETAAGWAGDTGAGPFTLGGVCEALLAGSGAGGFGFSFAAGCFFPGVAGTAAGLSGCGAATGWASSGKSAPHADPDSRKGHRIDPAAGPPPGTVGPSQHGTGPGVFPVPVLCVPVCRCPQCGRD
ncbi:hypothetical protein GCM10018966_038460 [Streptomyces yanii]